MNDPTRRRLFNLGLMAGYVVLPYSVTCMVIGGIYYLVFERKEDRSGGGFLGRVLGAPITLPSLAYTKFRERFIDEPAFRAREALHRRIGNALVTGLHADGIRLADSAFDALCIRITAEPLDERECARFGAAVARTIRQFPDVPLATICSNLWPPKALDEAWAARNGFSDWAVDIGPTCSLCGAKGFEHWVFGRATAAQVRRLEEMEASSFTANDGTTKTVQGGYACEPCIAKIMDGTGSPDQDT